MLKVVAGIIKNNKGEILISYRSSKAIQGNLWEFPGGKIEIHENPYEALVRELKEEIDVDVLSAHEFMEVEHEYPEHRVLLKVWWVEDFTGIPHGKEGQTIRWIEPQLLTSLPFPEGNKLIIQALINQFN